MNGQLQDEEGEYQDALGKLIALTHEMGLYDDCAECVRTGGHEI